jgi:uncharacterized membrane protein YjfL (UPF0719 family)
VKNEKEELMQIIIEALKHIGFLIEGALFLSLAFMVFWFKTKYEGANLRVLLTERDNPAVAVSLCGFLCGCVIAYIGSISIVGGSFWRHLNDVAKYSIIVLVLQVVADFIGDTFIFHGLTYKDEIVGQKNVAVAVGRGSVSVATGFILAGAFAVPGHVIWRATVWFVIGQLLLIAVTKVYQKNLTLYNDMEEIKRHNLAAGFAFSGVILAVGYTVGHAIAGEFTSWPIDLIGVILYIAFSLVLLWLMRLFTDKIILPQVNINDEIARDKNIGAGLIEGTIYVLTAMIIAFFLT